MDMKCGGSAKPDHVFHSLYPKEKKSAHGVAEVSIAGEDDEAALQVVVDLLPHFVFDLVYDFVGIGNKEVVRGEGKFGKVLFMILNDHGETVFFAGEVVPVASGGVLESRREGVVGGVDVFSTGGAAGNRHEGEGYGVMLAEADGGDELVLGMPV